MSEFKYFRSTVTGKVGSYPADFGDLFYDTFIEVDSNAVDCLDCTFIPTEDEVEDFEQESFDDNDDEDFPDPVVALYDNEDK